MKVSFYEQSSPGAREYNEDSHGYAEHAGSWLFVTADGLGGHRGGEQASKLAVSAFVESFKASFHGDAMAFFNSAFCHAQKAIREAVGENSELSRMKTTVVCLLIVSFRQACVG